jgi:hypothetical protein
MSQHEAERWREAWKARGRRMNGVGEFADLGPWWPPEERARATAEIAALRSALEVAQGEAYLGTLDGDDAPTSFQACENVIAVCMDALP